MRVACVRWNWSFQAQNDMGKTSCEARFWNVNQGLETELCEHELALGEVFSSKGILKLSFDVFVGESEAGIIWSFEMTSDL